MDDMHQRHLLAQQMGQFSIWKTLLPLQRSLLLALQHANLLKIALLVDRKPLCASMHFQRHLPTTIYTLSLFLASTALSYPRLNRLNRSPLWIGYCSNSNVSAVCKRAALI